MFFSISLHPFAGNPRELLYYLIHHTTHVTLYYITSKHTRTYLPTNQPNGDNPPLQKKEQKGMEIIL